MKVEKSTNDPDSPDGSGTGAGPCGEVQRTAGYKCLIEIKSSCSSFGGQVLIFYFSANTILYVHKFCFKALYCR